jgi:hypothetical protein
MNVTTLFEPHIIAIFVSQDIFNTEISIPLIGPVNTNLRPFRLARAGSRDDFVDGSRHGGSWLFWNSRSI